MDSYIFSCDDIGDNKELLFEPLEYAPKYYKDYNGTSKLLLLERGNNQGVELCEYSFSNRIPRFWQKDKEYSHIEFEKDRFSDDKCCCYFLRKSICICEGEEQDYWVYDKYSDGDPFEDEKYIEHFRTILFALKHRQNIKIEMVNRKGNTVYSRCVPVRLEYSEKDDKFRLITSGCRFTKIVNLARITKCKIYNGDAVIHTDCPEVKLETVTMKVSEERNTLERCMLHFAHFQKRAEKVDDHYLLHINFRRDDESEMVIRVLSFGPTVEVLEPESFKKLIIDKLKSQKSCGLI